MRPGLIALGKVVRAQGLKGELKVFSYLDIPWDLQTLKGLYVRLEGADPVYMEVERVRRQGSFFFIKFRGLENRTSVQALVGSEVLIPREEVPPLPQDTYYYYDIIGLEVVDGEGRGLGQVTKIFPTPANDVYVIEKGGKEWLIPATKEIIQEVDLKSGFLRIHLIEGLIEPEEI